MPACRAGDVTGCLADERENMAGDEGAAPSPAVSETAALLLRQSPLAPEEGFAPSPTRVNSSPAYSLAYSGTKMVEAEGVAPP